MYAFFASSICNRSSRSLAASAATDSRRRRQPAGIARCRGWPTPAPAAGRRLPLADQDRLHDADLLDGDVPVVEGRSGPPRPRRPTGTGLGSRRSCPPPAPAAFPPSAVRLASTLARVGAFRLAPTVARGAGGQPQPVTDPDWAHSLPTTICDSTAYRNAGPSDFRSSESSEFVAVASFNPATARAFAASKPSVSVFARVATRRRRCFR